MEASVFDREELSYLMGILNKKTPPPRIPPQSSRKSKVVRRDRSSVKRWSNSSDLDDFISEDDFLTADESATGIYGTSQDRENTHLMYDNEPSIISKTSDDNQASDDHESDRHSISSVPSQNRPTPISKRKVEYQPNFVDLTQRSDSSSLETSPVKLLSSGSVPGLPIYHGDPFGPKPKKLPKFKIPPGASPTIIIDSDPTEAPVQHDFSLSEYEIKDISRHNPDEFVMLEDRRRLLIWTIEKTSADLRDSIIGQVENASMKEVKSTVWSGLHVIERNKGLKIRGFDEKDSRSCLLLASWFVCWTIPVKLNTKGVDAVHLRQTMENKAGFPVFFEFLKRALATFQSSSVGRSVKGQRRSRGPALQEDESDYFFSSPRKKRKYAVPESDRTMSLRANALLRVQERDKRQELLKRRFKEMGVNDEDSSKVIVNPGKHDDQSFIYLNSKIADRIQPHQVEGVRFMWREVIADNQGCLLAQTMGLGKTMQVITLLVTIAEAAKSSEANIQAQVPEDLQKSRTLILCPPALIENWWDEFLMWTPVPFTANIGELRKITSTLKVTERLWELQAWKEEGGVLLLGFHTFRDLIQNKTKSSGRMLNDEQHNLVKETLLQWPNIIVADEAHLAKTTGSGINVTLNRVRSMTRIALTGSPLSNNLEEYHSLIDWISPGYLGTSLEFRVNYVERIQAGLWQDSTATQHRDSLKRLEALKLELAPKVHRADITVLQGRLKEKQEFVIKVALTPLQEEIYQACVQTMSTVIDGQPKRKSASSVWAWLAVLRLLCNHPKCFRDKLLQGISPDSADILKSKKSRFFNASISTRNEVTRPEDADALVDALVDAPVSRIGISQSVLDMQLAPFDRMTVPLDSISLSNKMHILMDILKFSREVKDKVLIFSHSLHTLNYVEDQLRDTQMSFSRIDGGVLTGSRQQITKDFNNDDTEVCLISTRAGGQGLNLFGANRVVILDDHFNPMYEEQAVGRAYRIGQRKPVFVYHLMAGGTFEEILHNQSVFKQQLAKRVVDQKNPTRHAFRALREYLLPPRAVEQKDLAPFEGKDKFVLDRILAAQNENSTIRSLDLTDTFHQEDTVTLTEEEKKEATQIQQEERLRRQKPLTHENPMARQRAEQSESMGNSLAGKPVGGAASQALMNFQSTKANQPAGFDLPPKDLQATVDSVGSKFRPHPTYHPSVQHPNTISLPRTAPHNTPNHLMPIPASSTQVQSNDPSPSTTVIGAGEDRPPTMAINASPADPPARKTIAVEDNPLSTMANADQDTLPAITIITASARSNNAKTRTPGKMTSPSGGPPSLVSPTFKAKAIPRFEKILSGEAQKRAQEKRS